MQGTSVVPYFCYCFVVVYANVVEVSVKKVQYVEATVSINGNVSRGRLSDILLQLKDSVCKPGECQENDTIENTIDSPYKHGSWYPSTYRPYRSWNTSINGSYAYSTRRPPFYSTYGPYRPWRTSTNGTYNDFTRGPRYPSPYRPYRPRTTSAYRPYRLSNISTDNPYTAWNPTEGEVWNDNFTDEIETTDKPYYNTPFSPWNFTNNRPHNKTLPLEEQMDLRDCSDLPDDSPSGLYNISTGEGSVQVFCVITSDSGIWTTIQSHISGSSTMNRSWQEYRDGFGDPKVTYWIGNKYLSALTANQSYSLRIDMIDMDGNHIYANYQKFQVQPESRKYKLSATGYSGNDEDGLYSHNGSPFSTGDVDNDRNERLSCSQTYGGGWWYTSCLTSDLNGNQPVWLSTRLVITHMRIRPSYLYSHAG